MKAGQASVLGLNNLKVKSKSDVKSMKEKDLTAEHFISYFGPVAFLFCNLF